MPPRKTATAQILEEQRKNEIAREFFSKFDCTKIIGKIDFAVRPKKKGNALDLDDYLLWAEAKKKPTDAAEMLAQLVLTIGKARTHHDHRSPKFLGCFDCEKIAFIEYHSIMDIFSMNDFNWNVAPSKRDTREFKIILDKIRKAHEKKLLVYHYAKNADELKTFIKDNFKFAEDGGDTVKTPIDKNNFVHVYHHWLEIVMPTIRINWTEAQKENVLDCHFYLADLLSSGNKTEETVKRLSVLLNNDRYISDRRVTIMGGLSEDTFIFKDGQRAHAQFWAKYKRPPEKEYRDYIIDRSDLLHPQDIRERKGSFFTPQIWVERSQRYIADVFGEDWQDNYYVWDCAAGTGNLLAGLTNKYNVWASTLMKEEVAIMHQRIENGANLLEEHCFQFDFLNDNFDKLPEDLRNVIKNEPEKLIVYINPPYAENTSYGEKSKPGVSKSKVYEDNKTLIGNAINEVFAQFATRIKKEVKRGKLAMFSKLKYVNGANFTDFRTYFKATFKKGFVVRASTFDNVKGAFPIGFLIWDMADEQGINSVTCDIIENDGTIRGIKSFYVVSDGKRINDWYKQFYDKTGAEVGILHNIGNDFQQNNGVFISTDNNLNHTSMITSKNLVPAAIYIAVRHCIETSWLNDRDQFLYPNDGYKADKEFQSDCLAYTLFHNSNNISSRHGVNHWIPFTESEVNARNKFKSSFMTDVINGRLKQKNEEQVDAFGNEQTALKFSAEAQAVRSAGLELWKYYHSQPKANVNASFYDIREYFQGKNNNGRMIDRSEDEKYNGLIGVLRERMKILAKKIEPKVYEYGFLRA